MKAFFYTKTEELNNNLKKIDELRVNLSIYPINPYLKHQLRWNALNKKINYLINLENLINNKRSFNILKNLENYIYHNFYGYKKLFSNDDIFNIYKKNIADLKTSKYLEKSIEELLKYIQLSSEHPIIQAGLAKIIFIDASPFPKYNLLFSEIIKDLFLYKYGYDFRRIFFLEENFFIKKNETEKIIKESLKSENLTHWLEFYVVQIIEVVDKNFKELENNYFEKNNKYHFHLNNRQKQILFLFDEPNVKITNKIVMKKFKISPVTAARDLAKLAKLNLILMIGKGRSTYYIKV